MEAYAEPPEAVDQSNPPKDVAPRQIYKGLQDDEAFFSLLIASERVQDWLDAIQGRGNGQDVKLALQELCKNCQTNEAYAEEARRLGAVQVLTRLLKRTDDEEVLSQAGDALAACSGFMASSGKVRNITYGGTQVIIKEGGIGDGIGARLWTSAHILCRELAAHPAIVRGKRVLEIGSGCGACGILAAKLGAEQVILTDYVGAVLENLRGCVHLNAGSMEQSNQTAVSSDAAEAGNCDSSFDKPLGEVLECDVGSDRQQHKQQALAWDVPPMHIRFYDWQDSLCQLSNQERAELASVEGLAVGLSPSPTPGDTLDTGSNSCGAPIMGTEANAYAIILATDVLYEWKSIAAVLAVLKTRLEPHGQALLCCAGREKSMFVAFAEANEALGLRAGIASIVPSPDDAGLMGVTQEYEAGFVMIAVDHADYPSLDWHRDGLFPEQLPF